MNVPGFPKEDSSARILARSAARWLQAFVASPAFMAIRLEMIPYNGG